MKNYIVFLLLSVVLYSCTHDDAPQNVKSSSLSYNTQNVFVKNTPIVNLSPKFSGGVAVSYSINPELPEGLSFNTTTGVISGTPLLVAATRLYTVTAADSAGGTSGFILVITVNDNAPSLLFYNEQNVFVKNYSVANLIPTISGGVVESYSISPALPKGLSIDVATGVISGTPTVDAAMTTYTVTATNSGGSTSFEVVITINNQYSRISRETTGSNSVSYYYTNNLIAIIDYASCGGLGCSGTRYDFGFQNGQLKSYSSAGYTRYGSYPPTVNIFTYTVNIITSADTTWPYVYMTNYTYDSSGRLIDKQVGSIHYTYEYYPDGNLYKYTDSNTPSNNKIYHSYDTRNNPLRLGGFTAEYLQVFAVSVNNPTAMNNETYTYQYNSLGYPIQKITTVGSSTSTTVYTYE